VVLPGACLVRLSCEAREGLVAGADAVWGAAGGGVVLCCHLLSVMAMATRCGISC
jgi:hypothetical protein